MSRSWAPPVDDMIELTFPSTEEELRFLDHQYGQEIVEKLFREHGVIQELQVAQLGVGNYVSYILSKQFGLELKTTYWFPSPSKSELKDVPHGAAVITDSSYLEAAKIYMEGYGLTGNIVDLSTLTPLQKIFALYTPGLKVLIGHVADELNFILRARYKGYSSLSYLPIVLGEYDEQFQPTRTTIQGWSGLSVFQDLTMVKELGRSKRIQQECNFDHHVYHQRRAKGIYP